MNLKESDGYPVPFNYTWNIQDATKIKCYMECPRKYFFNYCLGWRNAGLSIHLIFGSAWHEALAHMYENGFQKGDVQEAYHNHFLPYYRKFIDEADDEIYLPKVPHRAYLALAYYASMRKLFMRDYEVVSHEGKPMVEIGGTVNLSNSHEIAFKMDTIVQNRHGISSLEHKTGTSTWNWALQWYLNIQIGTYTHVLNCLYPQKDVRGVIVDGTFFKKTKDDPKKDTKDPFRHFDFMEVPVYLSNEAMNQWLNNTIHWLDMIEWDFMNLKESSADVPVMKAFQQNYTGCANWSGCEYQDLCRAWGNPLQHLNQIPIGYQVDFWDPLLQEDTRVKLEV